MTPRSLESALQRAGGPVNLLRNSNVRAHTFPVAPEFTSWRSEQRAWREGCALLDQSHHMTDLYLRGPDALRLLADFGVNSFATFTSGRARDGRDRRCGVARRAGMVVLAGEQRHRAAAPDVGVLHVLGDCGGPAVQPATRDHRSSLPMTPAMPARSSFHGARPSSSPAV
jgi:hypothetical protein